MSTSNSSPRLNLLLITNEPPHTTAAGAIYFYRLLAGYPAEKLSVISNCALSDNTKALDCKYSYLPIPPDRLQRTRFWQWRAIGRCLGCTNFLSLSKVRRLVSNFKPDAVLTLMQDSWYYELAARFARKHQLPLVLFIHDLPQIFEPVPPRLRTLQQKRDKAIYAQAAIRFCVSPGMESWFRLQYGVVGDVLLPPRSGRTPAQDPGKCKSLKEAGRLVLGFAGGLHYGYGEQIQQMIPALRQSNSRLEIFGPQPSGKLAELLDATDVLRFNGYAPTPEEAWSRLIERCDVLLLPYRNPPGDHELQYQTHFPSKLGDMLATGLPLLICGPPDSSGVSWFSQSPDAAAFVTSGRIADLLAMIEKLRDHDDYRVQLARLAQELSGVFDVSVIQASFVRTLEKLSLRSN